MNSANVSKIQSYLQKVMNPTVTVQARPRVDDSVEVLVGGEHVAVVYEIDDEGEVSYQLQMTILQEDLDDLA